MNSMNGYHFAAYRTVSWTPSEIASTVDGYIAYAAGKGTTVEYVDPYNLFSMIKQSGQGHVVKQFCFPRLIPMGKAGFFVLKKIQETQENLL